MGIFIFFLPLLHGILLFNLEFIDDDKFQITSDVGDAIRALEATFAGWKREPGRKFG